MSNQFQCGSCGGLYFDVGTDGLIYSHICGPMSIDPDGATVERPDARNENIDTTKTGVVIGIVSEGLGVTCLTSETLTEPPWITRLKASVPQDENER